MHGFMQIDEINAVSATPTAEALVNIYLSTKRSLPSIQALPEFQKPKGQLPIALAGGGPSIKDTVEELKAFKTIIAIGSAHDWLVDHGVQARYCVICDPDPKITAEYLKKPSPFTTYLVATQCHETVFKALEGQSIVLWHCLGEEHRPFLDVIEPGWSAIGGGCTAGLRAMSVAMLLGYSNIHFFGYDSCIRSDEEHHAYGFETKEEETGQIYEIKMGHGGPGEKTYRCIGYQLAQARNFEEFWHKHKALFVPTFHGGGLMSDTYDLIKGK